MSKIKLYEILDKQNMEFLTDLCSRIPYGVICSIYRIDDSCVGWRDSKLEGFISNEIGFEFYFEDMVTIDNNLKKIKPYLRPMSSMTEEERHIFDKMTRGYTVHQQASLFDWLNAHHFDYRGLIEKGLALSTEVFNPYKVEE